MNQKSKYDLIRRISFGKLFANLNFRGTEYSVLIEDPKLDILSESDFIYNYSMTEGRNNDLMTLDESYQHLKDIGEWTEKDNLLVNTFNTNLKILNDELIKSNFHKGKQKEIMEMIKVTNEKIDKLLKKKNSLWGSTCEFFADTCRKKFIIGQCLKRCSPHIDLNDNFLSQLIVCYYKDNEISDENIREIARTDPWRLYWIMSKETGSSLFEGPTTSMTDLQYRLCSWSRIYDFAFESSNRPTQDIIENDTMFDSWYIAEINRIEKEIRQHQSEMALNDDPNRTRVSGQETFIVCDREGAKEVYAMNNGISQGIVKERLSAIKKHGAVKDTDLPDIKRNIHMEANKAAMDAARNRRNG